MLNHLLRHNCIYIPYNVIIMSKLTYEAHEVNKLTKKLLITCSLIFPSHTSVIVFRWLLISSMMNPEQLSLSFKTPKHVTSCPSYMSTWEGTSVLHVHLRGDVHPSCPPERRCLHRDIVRLYSAHPTYSSFMKGLLPALHIFNVFIIAPLSHTMIHLLPFLITVVDFHFWWQDTGFLAILMEVRDEK